jgi:serine/threonine protein kinase
MVDRTAVHRYSCRFAPKEIEAALDRRFILGPEIAVGGQGTVFSGTRIFRPDGTVTNDVVALKLHLYPSQDVRVQREITATQNVSHPNLARMIEHGRCDVAGRHTRYIAWEFIDGQPLSAQLKNGSLLESEVLTIGRDVAAAISEIWSRRIVHGDIKPSNVMVRNTGGYMMLGSVYSAVLIDLGGARYLSQEDTRATLRPSRHFGQNDTAAALKPFGTPGYFSPEQIRGTTALSCASDVFSLGVVMLQCLLGRHPTGYDQSALSEGIQASGGRLGVSAGLLCALDKMLSARPTFRPNPAELSRCFESLRQTKQAAFDMGARTTVKAQN